MMRARRNHRLAQLVIVFLLGAQDFALAAGESVAREEQSPGVVRGRKIYLSGVPADGTPLMASVGHPAMEVPASILKCVNCHRRDGRGEAEGGLTPANIRWEELSKPSGG